MMRFSEAEEQQRQVKTSHLDASDAWRLLENYINQSAAAHSHRSTCQSSPRASCVIRRTAFRRVTSQLTGESNGRRKQTKKRYSQAVKDGFAEEVMMELKEEEGMIGGWSNEEVEGVIDVDVAANEEQEHHRQNTV